MDKCTVQEFKQMAKEFLMAMPTLNAEELDNGFKCFGIGYLTVQYEEPQDEVICVSLFKYVSAKHTKAEFALGGIYI